jgi:hypothetical protein
MKSVRHPVGKDSISSNEPTHFEKEPLFEAARAFVLDKTVLLKHYI